MLKPEETIDPLGVAAMIDVRSQGVTASRFAKRKEISWNGRVLHTIRAKERDEPCQVHIAGRHHEGCGRKLRVSKHVALAECCRRLCAWADVDAHVRDMESHRDAGSMKA